MRNMLAFFKGRVVPLILAILGLIVSYLYGPAHWTLDWGIRSKVHKAGEKMFVDWAGATIPVYDATTGGSGDRPRPWLM